ncbi:aldo/keto reductase [Sphaerochaeta sp. PS]|uniref:aldo/keto reductase n=1 Tax=Sphaerochaeta sp. PS TaxID=3076336 RepID=UPI0028A338A1|nr:aldo/keto reductase [Sphaerochaeta sp. PS]MDT4762478.1 aldo/keto reductase [Sphaerochaeta sp. PS]
MIARMKFGRTGHESSRVLFGAAALGKVTQKEADETLELLLRYGVNHIDTAHSYGQAELRIGPWMKNFRSSFFLATKTDKRTKQEALDELQQSLDNMKTDHIDLWQFHLLVDEHQWEVAMGEGGVLEAALEAKRQGLVRFLGVTGHGLGAPRTHYRSLMRYDFDSVLFPFNFPMMQVPQYSADVNQLMALCKQRSVAVQTIKALARKEVGDSINPFATWYEPLTDHQSIAMAVGWVLKNPEVFLNSTGDISLLPTLLEKAEQPMLFPSDKEMEAFVKQEGMKPLFS